jgi:acyl-CoA reductase-like NAD-dependent aldehyde dehydrogenase
MYDRAVEMAKAAVETIKVGDPSDYTSQMGPLNSSAHFGRVTTLINAARQEGATMVTGNTAPKGVDPNGYWVAPTIFSNVTPTMRIAREEVFGPVMSFMRWSTEDEVLRIANETPYGLTASVYGRDIGVVMKLVRKLDAGVVSVNNTRMHFIGLPFGGVKDSGVGGEESLDELLSYTRTKAVHILP